MRSKAITLLAAAFLSTVAQATWLDMLEFDRYEETAWTQVDKSDDAVVYIDFRSIKKTEHGYRAWFLTNYAAPKPDTAGTYSSIVDMLEFDCIEERQRNLSQTARAGRWGEGAEVSGTSKAGDWLYVRPGTIGASCLKAVCSRNK